MEIKQLKVFLHKPFIIRIELNSGTGYKWHVISDKNFVKLLDERMISSRSKPGVKQTFEFEFSALKVGNTSLNFTLKRAWEQTPAKKIVYELEVLSST